MLPATQPPRESDLRSGDRETETERAQQHPPVTIDSVVHCQRVHRDSFLKHFISWWGGGGQGFEFQAGNLIPPAVHQSPVGGEGSRTGGARRAGRRDARQEPQAGEGRGPRAGRASDTGNGKYPQQVRAGASQLPPHSRPVGS